MEFLATSDRESYILQEWVSKRKKEREIEYFHFCVGTYIVSYFSTSGLDHCLLLVRESWVGSCTQPCIACTLSIAQVGNWRSQCAGTFETHGVGSWEDIHLSLWSRLKIPWISPPNEVPTLKTWEASNLYTNLDHCIS